MSLTSAHLASSPAFFRRLARRRFPLCAWTMWEGSDWMREIVPSWLCRCRVPSCRVPVLSMLSCLPECVAVLSSWLLPPPYHMLSGPFPFPLGLCTTTLVTACYLFTFFFLYPPNPLLLATTIWYPFLCFGQQTTDPSLPPGPYPGLPISRRLRISPSVGTLWPILPVPLAPWPAWSSSSVGSAVSEEVRQTPL